MSDEALTREERPSRTRLVLSVVLVLLILLLAGMAVFFVRILNPGRSIASTQNDTGGLEWVRSMYGFGPAADEQLLDPTSVAIAPDGRVYATDPQRARVMIFSPDGTFESLLHTGAGGIEKGKFYRPESIDVDKNGDVYICDPAASKIIVFDSNSRYVREWPVGGGEEVPRGLWVNDSDESVYVLTTGKLVKFDQRGTKVGEFGSRGRQPGQIDAYQGVATDGKRIYIADALNQRVAAFDAAGKLLWMNPEEIRTPDTTRSGSEFDYDLPQDNTLDARGRLVTIDAFKFQIIVSDPKTGKTIGKYGADGTAEGEFFYPTGIDYDPARDWFAVADTRNNRVQIVRIPESGGGTAATLRRALSSPYRYCAIPLLLLILAVIVAIVAWRRTRRWDDEDDDLEVEPVPA